MTSPRHRFRQKKFIWISGSVCALALVGGLSLLFWVSSGVSSLDVRAWNYYKEQAAVFGNLHASRGDVKKTCYRDADPRHGIEVGPLKCQASVSRQVTLGEITPAHDDILTRISKAASQEGFKTTSSPDTGYYSAGLGQCTVSLSSSDEDVYAYELTCVETVSSVLRGYTFTPTYWYPYCSPTPPRDLETGQQCF